MLQGSLLIGPMLIVLIILQTPRMSMGGGYRLKSPLSCRSGDQTLSLQIGPPNKTRPTATPRISGVSSARQQTTRSSQRIDSAADDDTKLRENEAAEIERAYIYNLQRQVYYLELELESAKTSKLQSPSEGTVRGDEAAVVVDSLKARLSDIELR